MERKTSGKSVGKGERDNFRRAVTLELHLMGNYDMMIDEKLGFAPKTT